SPRLELESTGFRFPSKSAYTSTRLMLGSNSKISPTWLENCRGNGFIDAPSRILPRRRAAWLVCSPVALSTARMELTVVTQLVTSRTRLERITVRARKRVCKDHVDIQVFNMGLLPSDHGNGFPRNP